MPYFKLNKHVFIAPRFPSNEVIQELFDRTGEIEKEGPFDFITKYLPCVDIGK